jgi:hypothetical protein
MAVLIATLAVALMFMGVGWLVEYLATRRIEEGLASPAHALLTGWTVLSFVSVLAAVCGAHLTLPLLLVGIAGIAGFALARHDLACAAPLLGAFALVLPLMWIASRIPPTLFDEFGQWLPYARFLIDHDAFPDLAHPNIWSVLPGYPPGAAIIGYAVERISGGGFEIAPKLFVVMLAAAFGLLLADTIARRHGPLLATAVGVACATILNPFFDPRLALSAYADVPSGLVLAFCVAAYWRAIEDDDLRRWWRPVAPTILLLLLRETGIVLAAGLGLGLLLQGRRGWRALGLLALTTVVIFGLWRFYLWTAGMTGLAPQPLDHWNWSAPLTVVRALLTERLSRNPTLGAMALVIVGALIVAVPLMLVRLGNMTLRRLALMCASVAAVWTAFLAWAYMAVFGPQEVATAASTWRYLSQLGPMLIYAAFVVYAAVRTRSPKRVERTGRWSTIAGIAGCLLVPASIFVTWKHWRIDCQYAEVAAVRTLAKQLASAGIGDAPLAIVNPPGTRGFGVFVDYELHRPFGSSRPVTRARDASQPYLLDLSAIDRAALIKSGTRPAVTLMRRDGETWTPVLTIPSAPLPACRFGG